MIIDASVFVGEISIAGTDSPVTSANLDAFIAKYEPKVLKMLLGTALYEELLVGLAEDPIPSKWSDLKTTVTPIVANYVYYWYIRDQVTRTTGVGNVKPKTENGSVSGDGLKQVRAWNEMAELCVDFNLNIVIATYPSYIPPNDRPYINRLPWGPWCWGRWPEIYYPINSLNL